MGKKAMGTNWAHSDCGLVEFLPGEEALYKKILAELDEISSNLSKMAMLIDKAQKAKKG